MNALFLIVAATSRKYVNSWKVFSSKFNFRGKNVFKARPAIFYQVFIMN